MESTEAIQTHEDVLRLGPWRSSVHGVQLVRPGRYDTRFVLTGDLVCLQLGPHEVELSLDGSPPQRHSIPGNVVSFHCVGSEVSATSIHNPDGFVAFLIDPSARAAFEEEQGVREGPRHFIGSVPSAEVGALARQARQFALTGFPGGRLVVDGLALLSLGAACAQMYGKPTQPVGLSRANLDRAMEFVEDNLASPLGLEEMAEAVGLSAYHFARGFKAALGQSPHQFTLERRVARARLALEQTDASLAEIALDTGFSDQSHMTTMFRKILGVTPGQIRRDARANATARRPG